MQPKPSPPVLLFLGCCAALMLGHLLLDRSSEPYFNNDETRHVTTGVFFRDLLADAGWRHPREYATEYYLQYPALGLMVWPPFFYAVEGCWMYVFGTSFQAALVLIGLFALLAACSFFRLIRRTHDASTATFSLLLLGFSPLVFTFSRQVMLEIPALALALTSIYYFERYLDDERRWDAPLACLFAALTALTRFDGVFLPPYFALRLLMRRQVPQIVCRPVLLGVLGAAALTGPYYWLTWTEYGSAVSKAVKDGTGADSASFFGLRNLLYYPSVIPEQIGWAMTAAAGIGFILAFAPQRRHASGAYLALLAATYATFTPMAELEPRHAIYWVPALALLAAQCLRVLGRSIRPVGSWLIIAVVVGGTIRTTSQLTHYSVHGYEQAATYIVERGADRTCLMDGFLNGDFIYQVRRHDPERRWQILRGDKLLYGMLSDPRADYREWVRGEEELLELLYRHDPEWIVVEDPQIFFDLSTAALLRQTLRDHPERFLLERVIPIQSDHHHFRGKSLLIYRNRARNPHRSEQVEYEMLNLRRTLRKDSARAEE